MEVGPLISAVSADEFESSCGSGGIRCVIEVYSLGSRNAIAIVTSKPIPITLAIHRRRCHSAEAIAFVGIGIESDSLPAITGGICSSMLLNVSLHFGEAAASTEPGRARFDGRLYDDNLTYTIVAKTAKSHFNRLQRWQGVGLLLT
jgi:hypothetical protein